MIAVKMSDQVKLMLPAIMEQLRPLIVKGSPERERDFDAFMPIMMQVMNAKMEEFLNLSAQIYARRFTADEMRQVSNFYRTPAGDKFLQKQPEVFREATALGQQFGQDIARIAYDRMVEELRKRGHSL
ncbi:MAG TPA: DUF2059 domain-containing protein [Micropepsaceae bacterium]|nr:DUF2059 domain-containing protein [Micropepsaceae bacterium]